MDQWGNLCFSLRWGTEQSSKQNVPLQSHARNASIVSAYNYLTVITGTHAVLVREIETTSMLRKLSSLHSVMFLINFAIKLLDYWVCGCCFNWTLLDVKWNLGQISGFTPNEHSPSYAQIGFWACTIWALAIDIRLPCPMLSLLKRLSSKRPYNSSFIYGIYNCLLFSMQWFDFQHCPSTEDRFNRAQFSLKFDAELEGDL